MLFRKKKENKHGLMALVGETAKMAKSMVVLDKTEAALEREIQREKTHKPTTKVGKFRQKGEHLLHSKQILLMVVILNLVDCMLVLGELMLDIKYVTDLLTKEYHRSDEFIATMKDLYPTRLGYIMYDDIISLEHELVMATITWDNHGRSNHSDNSALANITEANDRVRRAVVSDAGEYHGNQSHAGHDHTHSLEEDIAHGLHKASITILGILVVETLFKIFCFGKELLGHKLECFDGFIVFVSFTVDLVFLKGLQQFKVQEFVLILAFLVPWRVIRVVNSLVVAIMDHEHFRLKLLYKQKKKTSNELKEAKSEITGLNACIDELEKLCAEAGVSETLVQAKLSMYRKVKSKSNPIGALSSFALGGDAMLKPFQNGKNDAMITIETDDNYKVGAESFNQDSKAKLQDCSANGKVGAIDTKCIEKPADSEIKFPDANGNAGVFMKTLHIPSLDEARPRSNSAIELGHPKQEDPTLVNFLAGQSVGFIATMSADSGSHRDTSSETDLTETHTIEETPCDHSGKDDRQDPDETAPAGAVSSGSSLFPDLLVTTEDGNPHAYINEATHL